MVTLGRRRRVSALAEQDVLCKVTLQWVSTENRGLGPSRGEEISSVREDLWNLNFYFV